MRENTEKQQLLKRISYIIGHLQGIYKMVDEGRYCIDVINQTQAVKSSIDRVNEMILSDHLSSCVADAIESHDKKARKKVLGEIMSLFKKNTV